MRVSVVVVSRDRPEHVGRCITSLGQLDHGAFEVIVVCDPRAAEALRQRPDAGRLKIDLFDEANISKARNRGLALCAGEVAAFIDDDAVAEPTWLCRLTAPFSSPEVTATGGFVRGRNGVSFQWRASSTNRFGERKDRNPGESLPEGDVWRTEGTNMAFRTCALRTIGGFDEVFAYYLDETDVNLRLPGRTVIVPDAEVHHGFAESSRRRADRVPRSLYDIGASSAYFLNKHAREAGGETVDDIRSRERNRLLRYLQSGQIEPRTLRRLLRELEAGLSEGCHRAPSHASTQDTLRVPFLPFRTSAAGPKLLLSGSWSQKKALQSQADNAASAGYRPTVVLFALSPRPLRVVFRSPGVWTHVGGQFGRGERSDPWWQWATARERIRAEIERIAIIRDVSRDTCELHMTC